MAIQILDKAGATYLVGKIKTLLSGKVDKETGKGLSVNDYTNAEKAKLAGVESGANNYTLPTASASVLGGVKVGTGLEIIEGTLSATGGGTADAVDWSNVTNRPTKLSNFTNDQNFQTAEQVAQTTNTAIEAVVGAAPDALDTLKELADALGNDANFASTITTALAAKLNSADLVAITNAEIDAMFAS